MGGGPHGVNSAFRNDRHSLEEARRRLEERVVREPDAYAWALLSGICHELDDCPCEQRAAAAARELALQMDGYGGIDIKALEVRCE